MGDRGVWVWVDSARSCGLDDSSWNRLSAKAWRQKIMMKGNTLKEGRWGLERYLVGGGRECGDFGYTGYRPLSRVVLSG